MIIPTLLIVSIIAFVLSVSTPGDSVEQSLTLEGITLDDDRISQDNYEREYVKKAEELKKDKALFYFSLRPSHYPSHDEWQSVSIVNRSDVKKLVEKNISLDHANNYILAINQLEFKYFENRDRINAELKSDWKQTLNQLAQPDQLVSARKRMLYMANTYQESPFVDDFTELLISIPQDGKKIWHRPTIEYHGLDNQYHNWISSFLRGDYGTSILDSKPVFTKVWSAIKWTSLLIVMSLIFSLLMSIPMAMLSAYKVNGKVDQWISWISLSIYSIPIFWMATLLIVYFTTDTYSKWLDIFPSPASFYSENNTGVFQLMGKYFDRLILPVICISLKDIAYLVRVIRADLIKETAKEYATTLRAKGVNRWTTMWKHILPNSMISTITIIISNIPLALAGTLIIEVIFNIPGMGRLMFNSILQSDWNVVYAMLLLISFVTVTFYLIGDIVYAILNPRITFENE